MSVRVLASFEPTTEQKVALGKAKRLEWLTLLALGSIIPLMGWAMGGSQSMKTAWIEDLLSLIPPVAYLVSDRFRQRKPDTDFPFGYHRATLIAFLTASVALCSVGLLTLYDALTTLVQQERPTLGAMQLFGHIVWSGWVMIPVLAYSALLPVILGRLKREVAMELHDKTLLADAATNRADWLTAVTASVGILGIGIGFWWADALAAAIISLDIIRDGITHLRGAVSDLMDRTPTEVDKEKQWHPLVTRIVEDLEALEGCTKAQVRLRDFGLYLTATVFLHYRGVSSESLRREAVGLLQDYDPELHNSVVVMVEASEFT